MKVVARLVALILLCVSTAIALAIGANRAGWTCHGNGLQGEFDPSKIDFDWPPLHQILSVGADFCVCVCSLGPNGAKMTWKILIL